MDPTTKNGNPMSAQAALDSLRAHIEKLEADLSLQRQEIERLRAERDEFRAVVYDHLKKQFGDPSLWDDFDAKDYTLTLNDLIATIREK